MEGKNFAQRKSMSSLNVEGKFIQEQFAKNLLHQINAQLKEMNRSKRSRNDYEVQKLVLYKNIRNDVIKTLEGMLNNSSMEMKKTQSHKLPSPKSFAAIRKTDTYGQTKRKPSIMNKSQLPKPQKPAIKKTGSNGLTRNKSYTIISKSDLLHHLCNKLPTSKAYTAVDKADSCAIIKRKLSSQINKSYLLKLLLQKPYKEISKSDLRNQPMAKPYAEIKKTDSCGLTKEKSYTIISKSELLHLYKPNTEINKADSRGIIKRKTSTDTNKYDLHKAGEYNNSIDKRNLVKQLEGYLAELLERKRKDKF